MRKEIFYDKNALKELKKFVIEVQKDFQAWINVLEEKGKLELPEAKKVARSLFEIRVKKEKTHYRGFYGYIKRNYIVILHFFIKKTKKTPLKNLKLAKRRLNSYE